jgi:hypothetical protein
MFQASTFRPIQAQGFMPQVRLASAQQIQSRQAQAFYPATRLGQQVRDERGFYPQVSLGQQDTDTAQAWYKRAKDAIAQYEFLASRLPTIASKSERDAITTWLGSATVPGTPQYRYTTVKSDFTEDVAAEGVGAYNVDRRQNRVVELEEYNDAFNAKLMAAGAQTYGRFEVPGAPAPTAPATDLTVPILVGAGAIALALIFG